MSAGCQAQYRTLTTKVESVIRDKWPEVLTAAVNPFAWAREKAPELVARFDALEKEASELWLNDRVEEFKKISTEWGQTCLQIMKQYAAHLRQGGAA